MSNNGRFNGLLGFSQGASLAVVMASMKQTGGKQTDTRYVKFKPLKII